jgi:uncharacterized protein (DUF488 family)
MRLVTIGVYGFTETGFFDALTRAGVDTFCDIRFRRGVRGHEYAFANHHRLETRLKRLGIRYLHFVDLAPRPALRAQQEAVDRSARTPRRKRSALSSEFVRGYQREHLRQLNAKEVVSRFGPDARVVALFCVEGLPEACHRSLLAEFLRARLRCEVSHLLPPS